MYIKFHDITPLHQEGLDKNIRFPQNLVPPTIWFICAFDTISNFALFKLSILLKNYLPFLNLAFRYDLFYNEQNLQFPA